MIETLGKKLKGLREARKLNQKQVATLLNSTRSTICCYENDTRQPSYDMLVRLAELYHVSTDYLLGHQNSNFVDLSGLSSRDTMIIKSLVSMMKDNREDPDSDGS